MEENKRVLLGMSGGTDSSVAAMRLLEAGYEVTGVTFRFYELNGATEYLEDARHLAERLGMKHITYDARDVFEERIVRYFVNEYMSGRTPVPCTLCNNYLKWPLLAKIADEMGIFYIATGHYARTTKAEELFYITHAADSDKDQTFFLWGLEQSILRRMLLPMGDITKVEARAWAAERGFHKVAGKKDSLGVCFCPMDYRSFIKNYAKNEIVTPPVAIVTDIVTTVTDAVTSVANSSDIVNEELTFVIDPAPNAADTVAAVTDSVTIVTSSVTIVTDTVTSVTSAVTPVIDPASIVTGNKKGKFLDEKGDFIAWHEGYPFYTIGQRRGLGIHLNRPVFVKEIRPETNEVVLSSLQALEKTEMLLKDWNIVSPERLLGHSDIIVKIRYRKQENHCTVTITPDNRLHVQLHEPLTAIAPGQAAAFYKDGLLLGGGIITDS